MTAKLHKAAVVLNLKRIYARWALLVGFVVIAAGCSSQTVFLNDYNLNDNSVQQVQSLLEHEGFEVQVISLAPPSSMQSSTLLSGSRAAFGPDVERLMTALAEQGYQDINARIVRSGNHWYRGDNFGLYLFDADLIEKPGRNLVGEYISDHSGGQSSDDCESIKSLTLTADQTFFITYTDDPSLTQRSDSSGNNSTRPAREPLAGQWSADNMPYIHLFGDEPYLNFYYQVEFETRYDFSGQVDVISLLPLGNASQIPHCVLAKGVRVS